MRIARSSMSEQDTECSSCSENFGSAGWWIFDRFELYSKLYGLPASSNFGFVADDVDCGLPHFIVHTMHAQGISTVTPCMHRAFQRSHHACTGHFNGHKFFGRYSALLISSRTFDSVLYTASFIGFLGLSSTISFQNRVCCQADREVEQHACP